MHILLTAVFVVTAALAGYTDFRQRRISNRLTFGTAVVGLAGRMALGGVPSFLTGAEGWLLGLALLLIPFALGWMGAGDVKLLAAFGALGGPVFVLQATLLGCIAGGAMALFCLVREHRLGKTLTFFAVFARHPFSSSLEAQRRMPFGPALAAGAAATIVLTRALL